MRYAYVHIYQIFTHFKSKNFMKKSIFLVSLAMAGWMQVVAQRTPTHPLDIKDANFSDLPTYLESWLRGNGISPPAGVSTLDDQFYISRVRPLKRIKDGDYQVREGVKRDRKMCLWVPLDDPTSTWKALPRYCFEGDNFSLWSYIDIHGNWTSPWIRSTAGITDVAHKNGVTVGCVMSIRYAATVEPTKWSTDQYAKIFYALTKKTGDTFRYAAPLVKMMKYYGINGLGVNSEFYTSKDFMTTLSHFFAACHKEAEKIGWKFEVHWYDGTGDDGYIHFDTGLGVNNSGIFGNSNNVSVDMLFANYNWYEDLLSRSVASAQSLGRSSFDYYASFDIQGRGLRQASWSALLNNDISIGFWGAHSQSLIHQSATDDGTADIAIQKAYLKKQELMFSGGNHNPALLPSIKTDCSLANASLTKFHGLATFLTAKSTIQQLPFVTRFNLGNGLKFYKDGQVAFDHKWYNLNTQDFMPTWRWWITNRTDNVTQEDLSGFVKAELSFDDAYWGGSCLSLSGQTDYSRVKLFKTMLEMQPEHEFSVTYKTIGDKATHARLFVALKDQLTTYKEIPLPDATTEGEWTTFTTTAAKLGLKSGDKVAMMGLVVENSPANYQLRVGEMAVREKNKDYNTVTPTIKTVEVLRGRHNACDFKMQYASREESGWEKTYNDEVGTWYYEIYFQQKDQPEQLLTATTSWAAYVVDAPMITGTDNRLCRFGVRAVAPDGKSGSGIVWTEYREVAYDQPLNDIVADREVIKPNETFKLSYLDGMVPAAQQWRVATPVTNETVASIQGGTSATMSIDKVGTYDLYVTDHQGRENIVRGKVKITPETTGAVPTINTITPSVATQTTGQPVTYTFDGRRGEGKASRGLAINDPKMFMIPGDVQQGKSFSYALWFKADVFYHDKQGTNLINKNTVQDKWPHNNWGDLWVTIRPQWTENNHTYAANEISFNTMGWEAHDVPNTKVLSKGYSVTPGVWNHIVVTQSADNLQKIYFNGRKVCESVFTNSTRREQLAQTDNRIHPEKVANIFFGGGGVYKSGFNGVIDEVQVWDKPLTDDEVLQCMKGYKASEVPKHLKAYFTFEEVENNKFKNLGSGGRQYDGNVVMMVGSGGENTASADYQEQLPDNNVLGFPGIEGTFDVKTTATWNSDGKQISSENDQTAVISYAAPGKKNVTLRLTNGWGEAEKTIDEIVEITEAATNVTGIEADTKLSLYPNPFVESVNLRFGTYGHYTVNIVNAAGAVLQTNTFEAAQGQVVNVAIKGSKGVYIVQIIKDGKTYQRIKVIKK